MEGMDEIQANIRAMGEKMLAAAAAAGDESAHLLESYAKAIAPWTDRTTHLRKSIKGSSSASLSVVTVMVSESMTYAPFVELGGTFSKRKTTRMSTRKGKITAQRISDRAFGTISKGYPALWPTVASNTETVRQIFKRHMGL